MKLADVPLWPEASFSCVAAVRPESWVKPTCRDRSTDAVDPERTYIACVRRCRIASFRPSSAHSSGSPALRKPSIMIDGVHVSDTSHLIVS